jgi:GT2 family glycosyltransferase
VKIIVIIVTYNGINCIEECLESVLSSTLVPDIYIIDNNSKDGTVNLITEKYSSKLTLHQTTENLGFGKGNNIGLSYSLKNQYDYTILLNQDAYLDKDTIEKLVSASESNSEFGILSPIHLTKDRNLLEYYFATFVNHKINPSFYSDFILGNKIQDVYSFPFISAAIWLLPKKSLATIGGFDPIFWHYGEDDNFCQRVIYHNLKIGVVSNAFARHDTRIRIQENSYKYSEKYYLDYQKNLQCKYANINYDYNFSLFVKFERNKIIKNLITSLFSFKTKEVVSSIRLMKLLQKEIPLIKKSRAINKNKSPNYIS